MKSMFHIAITTNVILIITTLLTMTIRTPYCGNNTYGFPFTFLTEFGGKRANYLTPQPAGSHLAFA